MKARVTFKGTYRQCRDVLDLIDEHSSNISLVEHLDDWRCDVFYDDYDIAEQVLNLAGWREGEINGTQVSLERW